ncbi:MAG: glutamine synthetase family protein [Pseudomonadota bacterium]
MRLPLSILAVDIWGRDVLDNPIFVDAGDPDAPFVSTGRGPVVSSRNEAAESMLLPMWCLDDDGRPHPLDPRGSLSRIAREVRSRGLQAGIGTELEFYLVSRKDQFAAFPASNTLGIGELERFEPLLREVERDCALNGIEAEASVSEGGRGQFEVVLRYSDDILGAADDFVILKHIVRRAAGAHGYEACFMAKPFAGEPGNGFHTHVCLKNAEGENIFLGGLEDDASKLRHAVGGLLKALPQSMLVFAPHYNSYRRFFENSLAPTRASWGLENRTTAIRIADAAGANIRIEHRVAGADANPYLVIGAVLLGILAGLDRKIDPGDPVEGSAYSSAADRLPDTWNESIRAFSDSTALGPLYDPVLHSSFLAAKRQELSFFTDHVSDLERSTYGALV